jgi:transketolase
MPCWELFDEQSDEYKERVFPPSVKRRVSVEAASTLGWHKWTGSDGIVMGIDRYGESAPCEEVYEHLGLTVENVVENARRLMS